MNKIDINDRYPSDGEIRVDKKPYFDYYQCLISTFNNNIKSFCDIGCATGHILFFLKLNDTYSYIWREHPADNRIKHREVLLLFRRADGRGREREGGRERGESGGRQ